MPFEGVIRDLPRSRAFSGEVDTGSPQKMRSRKEKYSESRFHLNGIRFRPADPIAARGGAYAAAALPFGCTSAV
jgi:hypothetical protein